MIHYSNSLGPQSPQQKVSVPYAPVPPPKNPGYADDFGSRKPDPVRASGNPHDPYYAKGMAVGMAKK